MMIEYLKKNRIELIILCLLTLVFNIAIYLQSKGCVLTFFDTDDYMRLVRICDFFHNYDLRNNIIDRCNFPYGCNLHWTRFYDFFLIVPAYIFSFFNSSIEKSIEYVGFFISPIIKTITIIFLFKLLRSVFKKDDAFLAAAILAANPVLAQFGTFGRPDHHAFIVLFIIIFLDNIAFLIKSRFLKGYIQVAISSAICIWISPETLIPILLTDAILILHVIFSRNFDPQLLISLYLKSILIACFIGVIIFDSITKGKIIFFLLFSAFILVLVFSFKKKIILVCFMCALMQPFLLMVSPVYYDEISVVHFSIFIYMSLFLGIFYSYSHKFNKNKLILFLVSIIIGILFLCSYPKFLFGMGADVDQYIKKIWLNKIAEMKSPFEHGEHIFYMSHVLMVSCAILWKICEIWRRRCVEYNSQILLWKIFLILSFSYLIFGGFASRMLPYSMLFGTLLIINFCMNEKHLKKNHRAIRIILAFFMSSLFMFVTVNFQDDDGDKNRCTNYSVRELFLEVDRLSDVPIVIMAHSNDGPMILYYTKHCVVGAPYHRQAEGILSSYKIMESPYSEDEVVNILKKTNASYIFVRKFQYADNKNIDSSKQRSLAKMIVDGDYPSWITIVKLPEKFDDILIGKINKINN